jgi:hypothetical protein
MKAWELLEEKDWCQGDYARNAFGHGVEVNDPRACSFCAVGLLVATGTCDLNYPKLKEHLGMRVVDWNDDPERTKEEVLAVLKELDI